jgi:lipid-binding SYLF domain-containing protein
MKAFVFSLVLAAFVGTVAHAVPNDRRLLRRISISSDVLADNLAAPKRIPKDLIARAQCIGAMRLVKAGFIFAGEGATGLVSCRIGTEWSLPLVFNLGGPSVGLQLGLEVADVVLLFCNPDARETLSRGSVNIGGDIGIAFGPVGEQVGAGVNAYTGIVMYAYARGFFPQIALKGQILHPGDRRNETLYGEGARAKDILATPARYADEHAKPLVTPWNVTLENYGNPRIFALPGTPEPIPVSPPVKPKVTLPPRPVRPNPLPLPPPQGILLPPVPASPGYPRS